MFGLGKKKCAYCRKEIENGAEIFRDAKKPGYVGTFRMRFCSEEHADSFVKEADAASQQRSGGSCCG